MKKQKRLLAAGVVLGLMAINTHAALIFTIQQDGSDVTMTGSGSADITALSPASTAVPYAAVRASDAWVGVGAIGASLQHYTGITGPRPIGGGTFFTLATTSSGDNFMMNYYSLFLPQGYVSGSQLSGTATFSNKTIADLGLTEGTYVYTWGSGANADSATIQVAAIPEPSVMALSVIFGGGVLAVRRIFML